MDTAIRSGYNNNNNNNNNRPNVISQVGRGRVVCMQALFLPCEGRQAIFDKHSAQGKHSCSSVEKNTVVLQP